MTAHRELAAAKTARPPTPLGCPLGVFHLVGGETGGGETALRLEALLAAGSRTRVVIRCFARRARDDCDRRGAWDREAIAVEGGGAE